MFTTVPEGHLTCEHCGGRLNPVAQMRAAGWGSPEVWEYECVRCGSVDFSEVNPNDVPLVPRLE
jgi:hypothetical protein